MAIFEPIRLEWSGKQYTIPPDQVLRTIAAVEDFITLGDLSDPRRPPLAKISRAFGFMLRAAGATVTDEEVYSDLFAKGSQDLHNQVINAVFSLQVLMIPPEHLRSKKAPDEGKEPAAAP